MERILLVHGQGMRVLRVPGEGGVYAFREFTDRQSAVDYLRPLEANATTMHHLRLLLAEDSTGIDVLRLSDEQVVQEIAQRIIAQRVGVASPLVQPLVLPEHEEEEAPPPAAAPAKAARKPSWVEFVFVYPDGTPVSGLDYVLEDPDGIQEAGTLPDNGTVRKDDIPDGTYTVILKAIESVDWSAPKIRCDESVKVRARVSGYVYGAPAKVKIYRELKETAADVIDTLNAKVLDDRIEVEWKYSYTSSDERKNQTGTGRFIAEVEMDGGKRWAKSPMPLEVELKSIRSVNWSASKVEKGGGADLAIEAQGYANGTAVKLELWRVDPWGQFQKSKDLPPAKLSGGKCSVHLSYGGSGGNSIADAGEYFVVARIEDQVKRSARSDLLWCVYQEAEATSGTGG